MTAIKSTYIIKARNVNELQARVDAANKIAKRLGITELTLEIGKESFKKVLGTQGWYKEFYNEVTINGEYPQFNGWDFVTQLDHASGLVRSYGETNHRHHLGDTTCDHCNTSRKRNVTYVIKNEENKEIRVGGSCLKYYIPTKSVDSLASFFSAVESFSDEFVGGGGAGRIGYTTTEILAWACAVVERDGRYIAGGETKFSATRCLNAFSKEAREERDSLLEKVDFDKMIERAIEIREWVASQEATNDFMHNVIASCKPDYIESKHVGFCVASIVAFNKAREQEIIKQKESKKAEEFGESEYVGTIKKRETFTVTLEALITIEGYYGDTYIHKFRDEQNNSIVWFGSKRLENSDDEYVQKGDKVTVKATVKSHEEYKDEKQTNVQRVAFVS